MDVDYIVVGLGLAGISFCNELTSKSKTFVVFDNASQQSSVVAGGLYNPVVLKRFTPVWKSDEQLTCALNMYNKIEKELNVKIDYKLPVYRKFTSTEEQNDWFAASDKPLLSKYLSLNLLKNVNPSVNAPFGFGEVLHTGRIDVNTLIEVYKEMLIKKNVFFNEGINYLNVKNTNQGVVYGTIKAKHLVFAEGFGIHKNPFFRHLPLVPAKGELLVIRSTDLKIDYVLKGNGFIIPLGNNLYLVGATYEWKDISNSTSHSAKSELLEKLKKLINCEFEVVGQHAGIRPTVKDRRPLVGRHAIHKNIYVLNGLGTRGVMIAPYVAHALYNFIENNKSLDFEIDIRRFD